MSEFDVLLSNQGRPNKASRRFARKRIEHAIDIAGSHSPKKLPSVIDTRLLRPL
jgi:hypothetical protein